MRTGVYIDRLVLEGATNPARRHALDIAALLLTLDCRAAACGPSAARILGLDLVRPPTRLTVATSADVPSRDRNGYVLRPMNLPTDHVRTRYGVPLTCAARTVIDLARESLATGLTAADSALRDDQTTRDELRKTLTDCLGWPGIDRARRAVDLADARSESALESVSRVAMFEQGLPAPRIQVEIGDGGGPFARVDFAWPEVKVIGEADGLAKYEPDGRRSTRQIVRAEKRREERLAHAGFEVVRWGWTTAMNPPLLASRLRAAFARGAARTQNGKAAS